MPVCVRSKSLLVTWPHCSLNNEDIRERLLRIPKLNQTNKIMYMVISKEYHQDGEEHHHAFILLDKQEQFNQSDMRCLDLMRDNEADWNAAEPTYYHPNIKGTRSPKEAIKYVKKDGCWITYGQCPYKECLSTKEKNSLLRETSLLDLVESGDLSIFKVAQLKKAKEILQDELLARNCKTAPTVYWYYGETGTGKTSKAVKECERLYQQDYWISHATGQWFDGYKGQKGVILDDIRADTWSFSTMLRITDRYEIEVPIKGGFRRWNPRSIYITAPGRPEDVYKNYATGQSYDGIEQLLRRIGEDHILEFPRE